MADEDELEGGGGGAPAPAGKGKGGDCPACLPGWFATYSDMVTLLLTFFVLLLSFAKTETAKYESVLGSLREAFGGNVLKQGEVLQLGKSPDDQPVMMDASQPIKPFPIDFLTMEGLLDKHEMNRESAEDLKKMRNDLKNYQLSDSVDVYEMPEGIKVRVKDKIYFKEGDIEIDQLSVAVFERMLNLLKDEAWTIFVEGHAAKGERGKNGEDAFSLSSSRASAVSRVLIRKGIDPGRVTTVFYGDSRPDEAFKTSRTSAPRDNRRVEFLIRKIDLRARGHRVEAK